MKIKLQKLPFTNNNTHKNHCVYGNGVGNSDLLCITACAYYQAQFIEKEVFNMHTYVYTYIGWIHY